MKIAYYCQHVLGVGHVHRSLEICRACAADSEVTMILGGPPLDLPAQPFALYQLPGLMMDERFSGLHPCDPDSSLDDVKTLRRRRLLSFFRNLDPDALVIELFPFGRKAFRFELVPLLESVERSRCRVFCSLRDILVEKSGDQHKHERRAVQTLNRFFDALLVHSDPRLVRLEETFSRLEQIEIPVLYTGFITPQPDFDAGRRIRDTLGLAPEHKLIVTSIGSGSVGSELLQAVHAAAQQLTREAPYRFQTFTGPYCDQTLYENLRRHRTPRIGVERFTGTFTDWLAAADLSISMAGYNTSMNVLAAGVPALMMPFDQNREQRLRITKLTGGHPLRLIDQADLQPGRLIPIIQKQLALPRYRTSIDLDGASHTARFLETRP